MSEENKYDSNEKFCYTEDSAPILILNQNLQCKDCKFRYSNSVIECGKYVRKPDYVLDKEKECVKYQKQEE